MQLVRKHAKELSCSRGYREALQQLIEKDPDRGRNGVELTAFR